MISVDGVTKSEIRAHYELATLFYRMVWGVHIHHGLWYEHESPRQAQRQLIEHLRSAASIPRGARTVDVGCGMGGSAIHLAKHHECDVTGITLSAVQCSWAKQSARLNGVRGKTRFLRRDAETAAFDDASFDYLWSIECTEHFFDKPAFFRRASQWITPGGGAALCIWVAGDEPHADHVVDQVIAVCDAFLCPSLGTVADYETWLTNAGLEVTGVHDLTAQVMRTWEICTRRVKRSGVALLSRLLGKNMTQFVDNFETLLRAYQTGAMKYCSIVATKPT